MKVSKFQVYLIILRSLSVMLFGSLKVLWMFWTHKISRVVINELDHEWSSKVLAIVKANYQIVNPYNVSLDGERSHIIMSNHRSLYDIPLALVSLPGNIRMIAKQELFRVPIWGGALSASEYISIDRSGSRKTIKDLRFAKEKILSGIVPWIAPEGTRSRTGELGPFKKGGFKLAIDTDAIIIPMTIVGSERILPPKTIDFSVGEKVTIHIGRPIDVRNYPGKNVDQLMQDTEAAIRENLEAVKKD